MVEFHGVLGAGRAMTSRYCFRFKIDAPNLCLPNDRFS